MLVNVITKLPFRFELRTTSSLRFHNTSQDYAIANGQLEISTSFTVILILHLEWSRLSALRSPGAFHLCVRGTLLCARK
jgi:hypothetical protein